MNPTYPGRSAFMNREKPTPGTQCDAVLRWLTNRGNITAREAMEFGCYRLAARIKDLRDMGYRIDTHTEPGGAHARYELEAA